MATFLLSVAFNAVARSAIANAKPLYMTGTVRRMSVFIPLCPVLGLELFD